MSDVEVIGLGCFLVGVMLGIALCVFTLCLVNIPNGHSNECL